MDFNTIFERNRNALLTLTAWWLSLALLFSANPDRHLPRRLTRYVSNLLSKTETSAKLLMVALANRRDADDGCFNRKDARRYHYPALPTIHLTIGDVISRLRAMQALLNNLDEMAEAYRQKRKDRRVHISTVAQNLPLPECDQVSTVAETNFSGPAILTDPIAPP